MAYYLVTASPREELLEELRDQLGRNAFLNLQPFGRALSSSLRRARRLPDGRAIWEEEDYCRPPLAEERAAVLDRYFEGLSTEEIVEGSGWALIGALPAMFPELAGP
jgi:hypothetical protein